MKIDQTTGSPIPFRPALKRRAGTAAADVQAPQPDAAASNVRQLPARADGAFDADRVAAIREEIRSGRYRINPERIADGLIAGLKETLGKDTE